MEAIFTRRSVRRYKDKSVEKEKIDRLLRAAMQAPSAGNQCPWEFIVVQDKERLAKLSMTSPYAKLCKEAPLVFVLLSNMKNLRFPEHWEQDMGAATENILLEAVHLNLGSVWLGVAPAIDRIKYLCELFELPEHIQPYCLISIGYPLDEKSNYFIDRYNEMKVHYEKF